MENLAPIFVACAAASKRGKNGRGASAAAAAKKPRQPASAKTKKAPDSNSAKKKTFAQEFPTSRPKRVPKEIDRSTTWRWYNQWQVWQGRLKDTGDKTLFCGLCGFVCPGEKKIKKHFLAEHGDKKFYSCMYCDKRFCLLSNLLEHKWKVHDIIKRGWRYDWGPRRQQTEMLHFQKESERYFNGQGADDSDDESNGDGSDHEYYGDEGADESDPDSEGAHEGAEEEDE
jgi:hypothetical protein